MANNTRKFYVTKSGFGFEEGIYSAAEVTKLPEGSRKFTLPLSVAISQKLVIPDSKSGNSVYSQDMHVGKNSDGKTKKDIRGVLNETISENGIKEAPSSNKLGNSLRAKLEDIKVNSAEKSLKEKIEAKKQELKTIKK